MRSDFIIGLFSPLNQDLTSLYNHLRTIGEVRLIVAGQTNMWAIDLLVFPDNMGIIPTIGGLSHGKRVYIPSKPIHPHFFLFWEENPIEKFIDPDERNIPIIGVGDAAAMLYDTVGGKIIIDSKGNPQLLSSKLEHIITYGSNKDYVIQGFNSGSLYGAMNDSTLTDIIKDVKEDIIIRRESPPDDTSIDEEAPNNGPLPSMKFKVPIVKEK